MTDDSSRQQLAEALRDVVADQARSHAARPRPGGGQRRSGRTMLFAACLLWGGLGWLWISRPDWLFAPPDLARLTTPAQREAAARYALYLEAARVNRFRAANGRLPSSLAEAGEVERGVTLETGAEGFVLEARTDGAVLHLSERMNADSFLGDAISRLPRRTQ